MSKRSRRILTIALVIGASLVIGAGLLTWLHRQPACQLQLSSTCYRLEYARTPAELERGLGGRGSMPDNHGMLFIIPKASIACFWMKDMRYNLDIIWLDNSKRIAKIEPNLSVDSYPQSYCSANPTAYVLELNAGQTVAKHLQVGQQLNF